MNTFKHLPRLVAAALFAASASTAAVVADAVHAGQPAQGILAAAPEPASAGVSVGIGIGGPHRYYRYAYRGGTWVRFGFGYAAAPGYIGGYYLGYATPPFAYYPAAYYHPRYYPAYYGHPHYWHPYHGHPYFVHAYYGRPGWGWRR